MPIRSRAIVPGLVATCVLLAACVPTALAARRPATASVSRPPGLRVLDLDRHLDVNHINLFTTNVGQFAYDVTTGNAGLVWPRGSGHTAVFAAGLWLGAMVGTEVRVAVAEYSSEYGPGAMVGGAADDPGRAQYRTWKVVRWTGDPADSAHVDRTPAELAADPQLDPLAHHSWSEYVAGAAPYGAPTRIYRLPVTATPDPSDSIDVPGPDVLGDQMLWEVHNDADPALHQNNAGFSRPLGVEVQQTTFAFNRADELGNALFVRFRIVNKGGNTLNHLYAGFWSDPDLGGFTDDLVGCDVSRSLGFAYNATNNDAVYGFPPPAVGYLLLRGLPSAATGTPLGMTAFNKYIGGTDPGSWDETYNYLQGLRPDGSTLVNPVTGLPTTYFVDGDPVTGQGWLDSNPADRRLLVSSGPGRLSPGESSDVWAAMLMARGADHLQSLSSLRCAADFARAAFAQGFGPLPPPAEPCSTAVVATACPRPAPYWSLECQAGGGGQLSATQLDAAAAFVNQHALLFDWPTSTRDQFCATVGAPGADLRSQARREFATFLANLAGSETDLSIGGGQRIFLNPAATIDCPPLRAASIGELGEPTSLTPIIREADYLNLDPTHRRALEGVNFGLSLFGGGAGQGNDFFGSTINTLDHPDSFTTVAIRFSHTATQKCHRYLRLEKSGGAAPALVGRGYPYSGYYDCNFQVWDVTHNVQLEAAFVEKALVIDDNGTLSPDSATAMPRMDRTWDPSDDSVGDREYLFVFNRPYSGAPRNELRLDGAISIGTLPVLYVLTAKLRSAIDVIDDGDQFRFDWGRPPSPGADSLMVDLESRSLADPAVQQGYQHLIDCLSAINAGIGIGPTCANGPTGTLISLLSAETAFDHVTIRWYTDQPGLVARVERRHDPDEWQGMGTVTPDGDGILRFEDRTVGPGAHYDYRLAVATAGGVQTFAEVGVDVPAAASLTFLGARPRSGGRGIDVSCTLAGRAPVRLEIIDIAGRRLLGREFAGLDPGPHTLELEGLRAPSGIYLIRLTQAGRRVTGKAAIVR